MGIGKSLDHLYAYFNRNLGTVIVTNRGSLCVIRDYFVENTVHSGRFSKKRIFYKNIGESH